MVAEEYDRLTCRLEELEGGKADDEGHDADRADRAAFDDSPEGDRLHRYQAHWSRSLLRTLDAIHREGMEDEHDDGADGDEDVPVPRLVHRRRARGWPAPSSRCRPGGGPGGERRLGECSSRWRSEFGETNPRGGPKALEGRALWRAHEGGESGETPREGQQGQEQAGNHPRFDHRPHSYSAPEGQGSSSQGRLAPGSRKS